VVPIMVPFTLCGVRVSPTLFVCHAPIHGSRRSRCAFHNELAIRGVASRRSVRPWYGSYFPLVRVRRAEIRRHALGWESRAFALMNGLLARSMLPAVVQACRRYRQVA